MNTTLFLHKCQLSEQQQRITQEYKAQIIIRVEAERQKHVKIVQRDKEVKVEGQRWVEINKIIEE